MLKEYVVTLIDYNYWANGLILKYAERLKPNEYAQKNAYSHKPLQEILVHIMFAEWVWRERMLGNSPDLAAVSTQLRPVEFSSLDKLLEKWFDEEIQMREFVDQLSEEKLSETFTYTTTQGDEMENIYLDIIMHVVFHGMQHRAEAASILHGCGHSPGDIDFIRYLRQR
jgi:uncharacterized damage-inducible protein DinB